MSSEALKVSGARIGGEIDSVISDTETIRPLGDKIILEPLEWEPSTILEVIYSGLPLRGIVKAIGPGCYPIQYNHPSKAKRTKAWESKVFRPTVVKVGEIVELGGLEIRGYTFPAITWGGKKHVICREEDVIGVKHSEAA